LYRIDATTGAATAIGASFTPGFGSEGVGFDFNPRVDRIRVVSTKGQNLRLSPDTGAVVAVDRKPAYRAGDPGSGTGPLLSGSGYNNPDTDPATPTALLGIDDRRGVLQDPPNDGVLSAIGPLGIAVSNRNGLDVAHDGTALSVLTPTGSTPGLYTVNLNTGAATRLGAIRIDGAAKGLEAFTSSTS
jgi:hypothetical protein